MRAINPEMVTVARESRGLSQSELARRLSIAQGALSKIEGGIRNPSPELMSRLSAELDYPHEFFYSPEPVYGLGVGTLYHRKRQALASSVLAKIHAQVNIRRIHISRLLRSVEFPEGKIKRLDLDDYGAHPGKIAQAVRANWLLPNGPVQNVTTAIENNGGIVIRCDFGTSLIDAVSQWPPDMPPLFFVNEAIPGDRLRYSLAHELAHVIMHEIQTENMEDEANRFAAEFLMPANEVRASLEPVTLPRLAALKSYWKVSMAALLKRASDLEKISERQARSLWMKMGQAGLRRREPTELDIPVEEPTLFAELMDTYRQDLGYSISDLSALLTVHEHEVWSQEGTTTRAQRRATKKPSTRLHLVKSRLSSGRRTFT
jgi:Zn-dependent peptidase ImmA (M78 family)/transcriptional regulator with XRE-family HTH domain